MTTEKKNFMRVIYDINRKSAANPTGFEFTKDGEALSPALRMNRITYQTHPDYGLTMPLINIEASQVGDYEMVFNPVKLVLNGDTKREHTGALTIVVERELYDSKDRFEFIDQQRGKDLLANMQVTGFKVVLDPSDYTKAEIEAVSYPKVDD